MTTTPRFVIVAHDGDGNQIDSSGYEPKTLIDAARIAYENFRGERGCVGIIIRDTGTYRVYSIDGDGNAFEIIP